MIICNIIVIPNKKPRFQKEFIWRGQGYDCKWDFISNRKYNFNILPTLHLQNNRKLIIKRKLILNFMLSGISFSFPIDSGICLEDRKAG